MLQVEGWSGNAIYAQVCAIQFSLYSVPWVIAFSPRVASAG